MLHFQINLQSGLPVYRQLMDQIKYYAVSGILPVGAQLPSIRELARALTVNPTTVVKAYTELEHEGIIQVRQGKGAFLADTAPARSEAACEESLRNLARQLALEATQMGASQQQVLRLVGEEMRTMSPVARTKSDAVRQTGRKTLS
jgi:GntR family transcriptional regulator